MTLSQFQREENIVMLKDFSIPLEVDKIYEFDFFILNKDLKIDDNVNSLFKHGKIILIKETNKIGLDQIQEAIN